MIEVFMHALQPCQALPDSPPISSIFSGFAAASWCVLKAPAAAPSAIVNRASAQVDKILDKPETVERFNGRGADQGRPMH